METLRNEVGDAAEENVEIRFGDLAAAFDMVQSSSGYLQKGYRKEVSPFVAKVEKSAGSWRHMPQYQTGREVLFHCKTEEVNTQGTELSEAMRPGNSVCNRASLAVRRHI